jgi:hypothetical protein
MAAPGRVRRHVRSWRKPTPHPKAHPLGSSIVANLELRDAQSSPRSRRQCPMAAGIAAQQQVVQKHENFGGGLCVRWRQFDRGHPGGRVGALRYRPACYPVRRETVPMPTPCSRAIARMLLPAARAARIVRTLAASSATVAGRPSRVPSALARASPAMTRSWMVSSRRLTRDGALRLF